MSLTSLYQSFPMFFFVINEASVWTIGSSRFDERIVNSDGANDSNVPEVLNGIFKSLLSVFVRLGSEQLKNEIKW